jgi:hypothetical protein
MVKRVNEASKNFKKARDIKIPKRTLKKFKNELTRTFDFFIKIGKIPKEEGEDVKKYLNENFLSRILKEAFPFILPLVYLSSSIFILGILAYPHVELTRYGKKSIDPIRFYNKNLGIVKCYNDLFKITVECIKHTDYLVFKSSKAPKTLSI